MPTTHNDLLALCIARTRIRRGWSQHAAAAATGVSSDTWQALEDGVVRRYNLLTIQKIASGLHWADDWLDRILAGQEPTEVTPPDEDASELLEDALQPLSEALETLQKDLTVLGGRVSRLENEGHLPYRRH